MSAFACGRCQECASGAWQRCSRPRGTGHYQPTVEELQAALARYRDALRRAVDLTCNCASDPEFRALGHAEWCDTRAVLKEEDK